MYEIETLPGPCAFCYDVFVELKRIPGMCGDGVCETCDQVRAELLGHRFVPWGEQKIIQARRAAALRPAVPVSTAKIPHAVTLAYQRSNRPAFRRAG